MMHFIKMARKFQSADAEANAGGVATDEAVAAAAASVVEADEKAKLGKTSLGVEPAKEEPAKADPALEGNDDSGIDAYISENAADNPALELALGFLKENGIKTSDPAFIAAEGGDFTLLEALLAKAGAVGADKMLAIMQGAVAEAQAKVDAHNEAASQEVHGVLGEHAEVILEWARENALPEEKACINDMINAGGMYARAAGMLLREAYGASGESQPASNPVQFSKPAGGGAPLSARDYADAVESLSKKLGGGDPRGHHEYRALTARREASRRQGH